MTTRNDWNVMGGVPGILLWKRDVDMDEGKGEGIALDVQDKGEDNVKEAEKMQTLLIMPKNVGKHLIRDASFRFLLA